MTAEATHETCHRCGGSQRHDPLDALVEREIAMNPRHKAAIEWLEARGL